MMTSSMTSQGSLKVGPLYSFINEITFFMITRKRANMSSLNFLCVSIMRLWLHLYRYMFMTSLMTSPGHKLGQILKLIYLRQYLTYSVDQKLKISEMLMAIFLVYSTSGIISGCPFYKKKIPWKSMVNTAELRQISPLRENTLRHVVEGDGRYPRAMTPSAGVILYLPSRL